MKRKYLRTESYLDRPYRLVFIHDKRTKTWTAEIDEFPGCITQGDGLIEALIMLGGAITAWIEAAKEMGQEIPEPKIWQMKRPRPTPGA